MNGYLMQEQEWTAGTDLFLESFSPESSYGVVFEDDGEAAYFYAVEKDKEGTGLRILDALHIHETEEETPGVPPDGNRADPDFNRADPSQPATSKPSRLQIVWSRDWMKCALVIDGYCHALFDFQDQGGYNINEFPPPNEVWTRGDRKLTDELMRRLF
jgi:hypothetical protein